MASFANSFWPQPGPSGSTTFNVDRLWSKIDAGVVENQELLRFISSRANCSLTTAKALYDAAESKFSKNGFAKDDGASLRRTMEGLKYETAQVAKAHENVANNLEAMVLRPFTTWSNAHEARIADLKGQLKEAVNDWEGLSNEVWKLKEARNAKCSQLEEAEEDHRFAPPTTSQESATAATGSQSNTSTPLNRGRSNSANAAAALAANAGATAQQAAAQAAHAAQSASVAASNLARNLSQRMKITPTALAVRNRFERMRLEAKEREMAAKGRDTDTILEQEELLDEEGNAIKGQEKEAIVAGEKEGAALPPIPTEPADKALPPLKIDQLEIGGLVKHPKDWSVIFSKAKLAIPTTAVKVPLLGTTPDAHSGEDLVLWFRDNLDDLGGSLSRSHEFCRQLSEELAILRLVGELGSKFYDSSDAFYAWRPEAFHLEDVQDQINEAASASAHADELNRESGEAHLTKLPTSIREKRSSTTSSVTMSPRLQPQSPPSLPEKDASPQARDKNGPASPTSGSGFASGLGRSNTITSYLSSAYEKAASNVTSLNSRMAKAGFEGRLDRLRREAEDAEMAYRTGVKELDEMRMQIEELLASSMARAQKLEHDRLKAIKSVLSTYSATLASLNTPLQLSSERTALLQEAFIPASDLNSIIERYKTGPFRPRANVWVDFYHERTDVRFGIDLRHWRDTHDKKEQLPDIVEALLATLKEGYPKLSNADEKRKTWIYEVPLPYTHRLRNLVNSSASPLPLDDIKKFDLPVVASAMKLWLLELATPLIPSALYNDIKALYPSVGSDATDEFARIDALQVLLERVPKIHLVVLDALLRHLNELIATTDKAVETNADFISKLGHSLGPSILRPAIESSKTLDDRFPAKLFGDLLFHYSGIMPKVLEVKNKVEEERYAPKRQRTKMVDQRLSRSSVAGNDAETQQRMLKEEISLRNGQKQSLQEEPQPVSPESAEAAPASATADGSRESQTRDAEIVQGGSKGAPASASEADKPEHTMTPDTPTAADVSQGAEADGKEDQAGNAAASDQAPAKAAEAPSEVKGEEQATEPEQTTATSKVKEANDDEDDDDLDKPLATTSNLQRSSTGGGSGGLARRTNRHSMQLNTGGTPSPSSTGAPVKSRGPRPMSMRGDTVTSPTGSPLPAGPGGVRARAAMFENQEKQ